MMRIGPDASRRAWLLGAGALAFLPALLGRAAEALAQEAPNGWERAIRELLGEAQAIEGKLFIDLPEIAENGNTVPFTITVDSPMTGAEHVKSVHIYSTGNPQALISTFHFTPASGRAMVAGRLRLARTQDIVTIASLSDGRFLMGRRQVKVTIGGCGG